MNENEAHRHFSVKCFNDTWTLLEKKGRLADENRLIREMAHASLFHWLRRENCESKNISVGLWLISRVYSSLGCGGRAMKYAEECIAASNSLDPFYVGYGFEAAARASQILDDRGTFDSHLKRAAEVLEQVSDAEEKDMLAKDIEELKRQSKGSEQDVAPNA